MGIIIAIILWFVVAMIIDWWDMKRNVVTHKRKREKDTNK